MTDGGRLRDPGQGTTKASAAQPRPAAQARPAAGAVSPRRAEVEAEASEASEETPTSWPAGAAVRDARRGDPPLTPRALPDPGQDSTQRR